MRTPAEQMRALVDGLNKKQATRPAFPTGGDNRATEEALMTGVRARSLATLRTRKDKPGETKPLAVLQKQGRY